MEPTGTLQGPSLAPYAPDRPDSHNKRNDDGTSGGRDADPETIQSSDDTHRRYGIYPYYYKERFRWI